MQWKWKKSKLSTAKGVIYIQDYEMDNFEQHRKSLMMEFGLQEVIMATWVKTLEITIMPLLLTYNKSELPAYFGIPGEHLLTKVY